MPRSDVAITINIGNYMPNYTTVGCTLFGALKRRPKPQPEAGVGALVRLVNAAKSRNVCLKKQNALIEV